MSRITIYLSGEEREALYSAAAIDLRSMREQARWFIRQELERRGLLVTNGQLTPDQSQTRPEVCDGK